jgi:hypothetical protein
MTISHHILPRILLPFSRPSLGDALIPPRSCRMDHWGIFTLAHWGARRPRT